MTNDSEHPIAVIIAGAEEFDGSSEDGAEGGTLKGGFYSSDEALVAINARYFVGISQQETGIYKIGADATASFVLDKEFRLQLGNV